ncbi:hypothetical protein BV231_15665, partial [Lactiplantibacillus plantarum]
YGARPIRRAIQQQVEDRLSEELLSGHIKVGESVTIGARKGEITVNVRDSETDTTPTVKA